MIKTTILALTAVALSCNFSIQNEESITLEQQLEKFEDSTYTIADFLNPSDGLEEKVEAIYQSLNDTARIGQLIMPAMGRLGQPTPLIEQYTKDGIIGGVLLLNGTVEQCKGWIQNLNAINTEKNHLPFLYSADAEPSLVNRKITGSTPVKKANELNNEQEVRENARTITQDLISIGINYNFSPVVDMAKNATVGYRGYGSDPKNIVPWCNAFIEESQNRGVMATAKHFPGHGLVSGDTHKALQVIDGPLQELHNYPEIIANGVASIMVAHIAVKNNPEFDTKGFPATTSKTIVKHLLRDSLGFKGLIVTDAMGMGGVVNVANAEVLAIAAGCDILLMPKDAAKAHQLIYAKTKSDSEFAKTVELAVKRVIRAKICLGLI